MTTRATVPKTLAFEIRHRARANHSSPPDPILLGEVAFRCGFSSSVRPLNIRLFTTARTSRAATISSTFPVPPGILTAERVALNFVQHLSGIATLTAQFVEAVKKHTRAQTFDTRKTTPGWRRFENYAVRMWWREKKFAPRFVWTWFRSKTTISAAAHETKKNPSGCRRNSTRCAQKISETESGKSSGDNVGASHPGRRRWRGPSSCSLDNMTPEQMRAGENRQGPREDRGQRRCESRDQLRDRRQRRGFYFCRRAHAFCAGPPHLILIEELRTQMKHRRNRIYCAHLCC